MRAHLLVKLSALHVGREVTFSYPTGDPVPCAWGTVQRYKNRWLVITRISCHRNGNWTVEGFTNGYEYKRFSVDLMCDVNHPSTQYFLGVSGNTYKAHDCPF